MEVLRHSGHLRRVPVISPEDDWNVQVCCSLDLFKGRALMAQRLIVICEDSERPGYVTGGVLEESFRQVLSFVHDQVRTVWADTGLPKPFEHISPRVDEGVKWHCWHRPSRPPTIILPHETVHRPCVHLVFVQQVEQSTEHSVVGDNQNRLTRSPNRQHLRTLYRQHRLARSRWPDDEKRFIERMLQNFKLLLHAGKLVVCRQTHG